MYYIVTWAYRDSGLFKGMSGTLSLSRASTFSVLRLEDGNTALMLAASAGHIQVGVSEKRH